MIRVGCFWQNREFMLLVQATRDYPCLRHRLAGLEESTPISCLSNKKSEQCQLIEEILISSVVFFVILLTFVVVNCQPVPRAI